MCSSPTLRPGQAVLPAAAGRAGGGMQRIPGGDAGGATPVPIPNTVVKPSWADGTALATARESRSPPGVMPRGGESLPSMLFRAGAREVPRLLAVGRYGENDRVMRMVPNGAEVLRRSTS